MIGGCAFASSSRPGSPFTRCRPRPQSSRRSAGPFGYRWDSTRKPGSRSPSTTVPIRRARWRRSRSWRGSRSPPPSSSPGSRWSAIRRSPAVAEACGRAPRLYRPPYGIFSAAGLAIARRRYRPLLWTRWGRDWSSRATAESIASTATAGLRPGDVILLHDADHYSAPGSWRRTIAALPRILETLASGGLAVVAASSPQRRIDQ